MHFRLNSTENLRYVTLCDLDWLECSCRLPIEELQDFLITKTVTEIINREAVRFIECVAAEGSRKHNNNLFGVATFNVFSRGASSWGKMSFSWLFAVV